MVLAFEAVPRLEELEELEERKGWKSCKHRVQFLPEATTRLDCGKSNRGQEEFPGVELERCLAWRCLDLQSSLLR